MTKRIRATILILGLFAFAAFVTGSSLYWYPNRDDHAVRTLRRAGAKVRRTPRLLWLSAHTDTEIYPYGDVWDLEIKGATIDHDVADAMRSLRSLDNLHIWNCHVDDICTDLGPPESKLRVISIRHSNAGDRNLGFIAGNRSLGYLILENTEISDASIPTILSCRHLKYIVLINNKFSEDGIQKIRTAFPRANVQVERRSVHNK